MIKFHEVGTENEWDIFANLKIELMKYHLEFAKKFELLDQELLNYSKEQALSTAQHRISILFYLDSTPVGMAQMEDQVSEIDNTPILFIHSMYIIPAAHNKGIGGFFLRHIAHKYQKRIECECWYDLPACELYRRAGFLPLVTRYALPLSSRYYGSDQNCISE